ncbi:DNA binding domain protein, excisionase family [Denitrovibrio acetiphilus DSM 12809]|uniref:DNA binding domain protein, excisionase family n=1 Tax=Denitrovibrio acetiphilus (strain DSM 12809 / NBRC 114555 / N2460) TaxID=522772 RepID=D4H2K3_DENA2|nr:helix-turn-helix transcriptional regulator [Denitrovibrio acetiphilus]ADD67064.1 DNA binding domain protein, excisionase family [Denitrovibrio acetiphilus DSM 12809]
MKSRDELSVEDISEILKISKSKVYSLIKSGELPSYKVGRKIRFSEDDIKSYIKGLKQASTPVTHKAIGGTANKGFVLCGQDIILDILSNYMRQHNTPALRAYIGSYDSLIALYRNQVSVASAHLWDSDTDTYNVPYVRRLLPGIPAVIVHLTCRIQGFYVAKGNPKNITKWDDFGRDDITMVNREQGSGSRVLLDENLRLLGIFGRDISGYEKEIQSHLTVASVVASGKADVAIGSEKIAKQVEGIDFVPIKKERYDLVFKREDMGTPEIASLLSIIRSDTFRDEFSHIGGYDTKDMGKIVIEF